MCFTLSDHLVNGLLQRVGGPLSSHGCSHLYLKLASRLMEKRHAAPLKLVLLWIFFHMGVEMLLQLKDGQLLAARQMGVPRVRAGGFLFVLLLCFLLPFGQHVLLIQQLNQLAALVHRDDDVAAANQLVVDV